MIDRISLQNIGPFTNLDLSLERLTLLVGPNGAGKSTVLKAVDLVSRWHTGGFAPKERRKLLLSKQEDDSVTEAVWMYPVETFDDLGVARKGAESWSAMLSSAGWDRWDVGRKGASDPEIRYRGANQLLRGPLPEGGPGYDWADLGGISAEDTYWTRHYRLTMPDPPTLSRALHLQLDRRALATPSIPSGERTRLGSDGAGLPSVLAELDREVLEQIEASLARVVPQARRVRIRPTKTRRLGRKPFAVGDQAIQVPVEEEVFAHRLELEIRGSGSLPAELLSEGTLFALGLITALHQPDRPEILAIDDLDRGLHLSGQVRVMDVLKGVMEERPTIQVIGTTHSPFQLEGIPPEQVRVFALRQDGTATARALTEHPEFARWSRALRTAELWADLGEDWVTEPRNGQ